MGKSLIKGKGRRKKKKTVEKEKEKAVTLHFPSGSDVQPPEAGPRYTQRLCGQTNASVTQVSCLHPPLLLALPQLVSLSVTPYGMGHPLGRYRSAALLMSLTQPAGLGAVLGRCCASTARQQAEHLGGINAVPAASTERRTVWVAGGKLAPSQADPVQRRIQF